MCRYRNCGHWHAHMEGTMSTDMLAIIIEICIGILRLIEAAYN